MLLTHLPIFNRMSPLRIVQSQAWRLFIVVLLINSLTKRDLMDTLAEIKLPVTAGNDQ
jgi:hypothetical protein